MNNTKLSILITLFICTRQGKNHYTLVSVNKIIELLKERHGTQVKRRWVFQSIRDIIDKGLLSRKPRYNRRRDGTVNQLSSVIAITLKGAKLLVSKKISGSMLLLKNILSWIRNKDKRFPKEKELAPGGFKEINPAELRRLELLVEKVLVKV